MPIGAEERRSRPARKRDLPEVNLRKATESTIGLSGPDLDSEGVGGLVPNHSFNFRFTDRRGRTWSGSFKAHVLTTREKVQVGLLRAQLAGNAPVEALDAVTYNLLEMVSFLDVALDSKPTWADDLLELHEMGVLRALYEEVANYEARFHGAVPAAAPEGDGDESDVDAGAGAHHPDGEAGQAD